MAMLEQEPVRTDLSDDLDITGIPGQIHSSPVRMSMPLSVSISDKHTVSDIATNVSESCSALCCLEMRSSHFQPYR